MDKAAFSNPPGQYRPVPFWSWNDKLDADRLKKQTAAFAASGMGGFFMHPRPGIRTAFLSDEYFAAMTASVEGAQQQGLHAWLYDECSYPSGFAGGLVVKQRPDLAQKWLSCRVMAKGAAGEQAMPSALDNEIARYAVSDQGYRKITSDSEAATEDMTLQFTVDTHKGMTWLNDSPYVDLLHPESGKVFLELAYEPYAERYSEHFGSLIPGVFTDEPNIHPHAGGAVLPWTPDLPQAYKERYNDDLLDRLPELFADIGDYTATRYRYWRLVTDRFISAWMRPVFDWCDKHSLQFTGHLWEHALVPSFSGSLMAPLEYMHVPGMDLLGRDMANSRLPQDIGLSRQMGNVHMAKVVTSVAHQLGRQRVLSETYGGCGWEMSFETQKRYAEWEYALGVNLLNQHLSHYSLRGYRKHDYPISFMDYQPWWVEYGVLGDYFGRLSYALSQGSYQAELLVLHPMASIWSDWRPVTPSVPNAGDSPNQQLRLLETTLDHLTKELSASGWSFDFGDDTIMERHASVATSGERPYLQVGAMQYQAVVLPSCSNLAASTLRLLEEFVAAGGTVWVLPPAPHRVDGSPVALNVFLSKAKAVSTPAELVKHLTREAAAGTLVKYVDIVASTPAAPIYSLVRQTESGDIVFLANMGDVPHLDERVWLRGTGLVERWDLKSGVISELPVTSCNDGVEVMLDFAATESHLLFHRETSLKVAQAEQFQMPLFDLTSSVVAIAGSSATAADGGAGTTADSGVKHVANTGAVGRHQPSVVRAARFLADEWRYRRLDPNVLVLDRCEYRVDDEPWSGQLFTQEVAFRLRQRYGLPTLPFRDVQPWLKHPDGPPLQSEIVTIRYTVNSQLDAGVGLSLVVEDADCMDVTVNGRQITTPNASNTAYWLDPAFHRMPIGDAWQMGLNEIELRFRFHEDLPVEPSFLLGDFAVAGVEIEQPVLVAEPETLHGGSWTIQGYPFYIGRMTYSQSITLGGDDLAGSVWLDCSDLPNVAEIRCNGQSVGLLAWRPYRAELTDYVHLGENNIEIVVANSLHNALGPMHSATLPDIVGPPSYTHNSSWITGYRLAPDGVAGHMQLLFA